MTAPQAQQPSEWVEKAMSLAGDISCAAVADWLAPGGYTADRTLVPKGELRAHLTQREEAFAALLKALQSFVDDIIPNDPSDPLWVAARAALALARKGDGNE